MDSYDGQQYRVSTDKDSTVKMADTGARPKEKNEKKASHIQDQLVDEIEGARLQSDRKISPEDELHDKLLRERARLQQLVEERNQLTGTRRLQKEIEELRRQLYDVHLADIGKPAESKFGPRDPDNIQDFRASEFLIRNVDVQMPNEMTDSLADRSRAVTSDCLQVAVDVESMGGTLTEPRVIKSSKNPQTAPKKDIQEDEVPGRRLDICYEKEVSYVPGRRKPQSGPAMEKSQEETSECLHTEVDVGSKDETLTERRIVYSTENPQDATEKYIQGDEVPGRRLESFLEKEVSYVPGRRKPHLVPAMERFRAETSECLHAAGDVGSKGGTRTEPRRKTTQDAAGMGGDHRNIFEMLRKHVSDNENAARKSIDFYLRLLIDKGAEQMKQQLEDDLSSWKKVCINIAIAGESGSGKSSFINAVLGLTADDEGAADVGCNETTMEVTKYVHPERPNIVMYDLPGVGTPQYPRDKYLDSVNIDKYDFFLLLSHQRFKENDMWFAREIEKRKRKFFFVRTHIHKDIKANKHAHPRKHNTHTLVEEIRRNIREHLENGGIPTENLYIALIDNHKKDDYEFEQLLVTLIASAPEIKRESFVYSLFEHSRGILQIKTTFLKGRLWKMALLASLDAIVCEQRILFYESSFYRKQLGIDPESLKYIALKLGVDKDEIVKETKMSSYVQLESEFGLAIIYARETT